MSNITRDSDEKKNSIYFQQSNPLNNKSQKRKILRKSHNREILNKTCTYQAKISQTEAQKS